MQKEEVAAPVKEEAAPKAETHRPITGHVISAPMPGRVIAIKVKEGDVVKRNQEMLVLEAMKMENSILSDYPGTIKQILVSEGDAVAADAPLFELE